MAGSTRRRWVALGLVAVLLAGGALLAFGRGWAEFWPPHSVRRSRAVLAPALRDELARRPVPDTVPGLVELALVETGRHLRFGLDHRTALRFDPLEREANCIEYAELFARIFDDAAAHAGLRARALVVHSERARLSGVRLPGRGMGDHDWVLVLEHDQHGAELRRHFVDPTFYDLGLGWDIASSVRGEVPVSSRSSAAPRSLPDAARSDPRRARPPSTRN